MRCTGVQYRCGLPEQIGVTYRPDEMLQVGHVREGPLDLIVQCVALASARGEGEEPDV
jgi:hypothetical protein